MSLNNCITLLSILMGVIPVIKMAADKRLSLYNIFIICVAIAFLILNITKNRQEDKEKIKANRDKISSDSTRKAEIQILTYKADAQQITLSAIKNSLDSVGLGTTKSGGILITDMQTLKRFILSPKSVTNVTSINQKGGQTAKEIINNNR